MARAGPVGGGLCLLRVQIRVEPGPLQAWTRWQPAQMLANCLMPVLVCPPSCLWPRPRDAHTHIRLCCCPSCCCQVLGKKDVHVGIADTVTTAQFAALWSGLVRPR